MATTESSRSSSLKRRRITQACDYCHQRSIRCRPSGNANALTCQNCEAFAQPCTYNRTPLKRGTKPRRTSPPTSGKPLEQDESHPSKAIQVNVVHGNSDREAESARGHTLGTDITSWKAPNAVSQAIIIDLVEIYFEIVYPIFPFFHQPSFIRRVSRAEYTTHKSLFALVMAVCALVSGRVRDGSVTNTRWDMPPLYALKPEVFYNEAKQLLVSLMTKADIHVVQAHAILAVAAIQEGRTRDLHMHLGIYHTLIAMDGLHDESNWPRNIGIIEREERRRLFWSMYTLDIYSAVVWGSIIRCREHQSNVAYPVEVDDESIDDNGIVFHDLSAGDLEPAFTPDDTSRDNCWMYGWNFVTDLYRVLEHALAGFQGRRCHSTRSAFLREILDDDLAIAKTSVQAKVLQKYYSLPESFKHTPQMIYNTRTDRFGFQAANITATLQLLRIVLLAVDGASVEERCEIASDVVASFKSIPVAYLLAISNPLLYHLGGIGTILASVTEESLSETDYERIRDVILSLAQLLESLEVIHHDSGASTRLRSLVSHINDDIAQRKEATLSAATVITSDALLQQSVLQGQEQQSYSDVNLDRPNWMLEISGDILGDLTWNFDLG